MKRTIDYKLLLPALFIPLLTGGLAAFMTKDSFEIYSMLYKPLFSPPAALFPVVWTILYILVGAASYFVLKSEANPQRKKRALKVYGLQLGLNFLWPLLFFELELFGFALLCAALLLLAVIICCVLFEHISAPAGKLMLPYILWLFYAVYLNTGVLLLN